MHDLIKKAMVYANKAHTGQMYGEVYPYAKHLEDVYNILIDFGFSEADNLDLLVSSWLHDIIEDTCISYSDIKKEFNKDIAEIVYCITDELGRTRREKKEKTYPKMRSNPKAIALKVADRIANVRFSNSQSDSHTNMYKKEFKEFEFNLRLHNHIDAMWEYLEKLINKSED